MKRQLNVLLLYLLSASAPLFAIEEREGFFKQFSEPVAGVYPILTVPEGKKFVLLQINAYNSGFCIIADSKIVIDGQALFSTVARASHDYPDRCVVFESGQVLELSKPAGGYYQIVGYFYNCNCPSIPLADLNKDCKVNFSDLTIMASMWLVDNSA